eukprot:jgi/Mesvir1/3703/Mv14989-RA.1
MASRRLLLVLEVAVVILALSNFGHADHPLVDVYDDVYMTGNCSHDIQVFCADTQPGESRLSECLTKRLKAEKTSLEPDVAMLSDDCKAELREFKIERSKDITIDTKLEEACRPDVPVFCNDTDLYPEWGSTIACLREVREELTPKCGAEILRTMMEASEDFALDALVHKLCSEDAKNLCSDVQPGEGRVLACLRDKRVSLSWDCQEELFRQEVENADDFRLDARLHRECSADKAKFCKDTPEGYKTKDCLEDHRYEAGFSQTCKELFEAMMERRSMDFRLDAPLRTACAKDIQEVCGYEKDSLDSVAGYDGRVIECLQDYKDELVTPECKERVHRLTVRAAQDIRFDEPLADACYEDRTRLCENIAPGNARVIRCLQDLRDQLSYECRATLFDQEVRMAEDIDFQFPMKQACQKEIGTFCKGVPHGHARVIACLRDHVNDMEMSTECKAEVKRNEIRAAEDYRLNYRLNRACDVDIDVLCADVCSPFMGQACGGTVLQCLVDNRENISSTACKDEVFQVEKMQADDFRNDAVLRTACADDVEQFCADVPPGEGRVHKCLLEHRAELSDACRMEEDKLQALEFSDVRLQPQLHRACGAEIDEFCKNVEPGHSRVFACLLEHVSNADFSAECAQEVRTRESLRAANYVLDSGVVTACKADVDSLCSIEADEADGEHADVMRCLVDHLEKLSTSCSAEVGRAVKMALVQYRKGHPLTSVCDADYVQHCKNAGPGVRRVPSIMAGSCLTMRYSRKESLQDSCKQLISVTVNAASGLNAEELAHQIAALTHKAGVHTVDEDGGIHISGTIAIAGVCSLVLVIIAAAVFIYRKYTGQDRQYTLLVKGGDV